MKRLAFGFGLATMILLLHGCGCGCTEIGCISDSKPFSIVYARSDFSASDLTDIQLVRTDGNLNPIDTTRVESVLFADNLTLDFGRIAELYPNDFELNAYNYIVHTVSAGQTDTILNLDYTSSLVSEVCNECSGGISCKDDMYDRKVYENPEYELNGTADSGFMINLSKR